MIVLAIDLGETTGYAYVKPHGYRWENGEATWESFSVLRYGTIPLGATVPWDRSTTLGGFKPDLVVIERPAYVPGRSQTAYDAATAGLLVRYGKRARLVKAVDWKPRFKGFPLPGRGVLRTQHEKDAYRMAVWAMHKFGGGSGERS